MLIKKIIIDDKELYFSEKYNKEIIKEENFFTIIIGKNASGKSNALKELCHLLIRAQIKDDFESIYVDRLDHYLDRNYKDILHRGEDNFYSEINFKNNDEIFTYNYIRTNEERIFINYLGNPEFIKDKVFRHIFGMRQGRLLKVKYPEKINIIAVSSGQFDKFPVLQSMGLSSSTGIKYSYVGVQNDKLSSHYDSVLSLKVGEIGHAIIKLSVESKNINIKNLLHTLGFSNKVTIKYEVNRSSISRHSIDNEKLLIHGNEFSSIGLGDEENTLKGNDFNLVKKSLSYFSKRHDLIESDYGYIDLDLFGKNNSIEEKHLYYAAKVNALKIRDVYFEEENGISSLSLASSGQINLLNIFFGIASCIEDNSLVLIDEPEISLHADWQMQFIPLIREAFSQYKGCHYIIATHAPLIISKVCSDNSSILNMTTGETVSSKVFNNQSADYINSHLFETPGPKNETMNREVVSLLSAISKRKKLSRIDLEKSKDLIYLADKLLEGDPIKDLVSILEEALGLLKVDKND